MKTTLRALALALFAVMLLAPSADAIPAFARKYRMSCTTCHYPFPRLKAYGDDFAGNGFRLEDQDAPRYFVETGDDALSLIRDFPIAVRFDSWAFVADDGTDTRTDFRTPWTIKFLSGGALSDHVSYYFYFYFDEHGEVAGIDDAFIMFNDILTDQDLDIYMGQFNLSDPMLKGELRLTYEPYQAYKAHVGNSRVRLYYDRGVMATYGMPWGSTGITAMVVNGNGIGEFNGDYADDDTNPVFAGHLSQDVGDMLSLGAFGLVGSEDGAGARTNDVSVFGINGTFETGPLQFNGQYLMRSDSNPMLFIPQYETEHDLTGIIAEAIWWPNGDMSRFFLGALYNRVEGDAEDVSGLPVSQGLGYMMMSEGLAYETVTLHFGHLARTNIRIGLEGTYDLERETFRTGLGVVAAW